MMEQLDGGHAAAIPITCRPTVEMWLYGRPETTVRTYSRDIADLFLTIAPRRLEDVTLRDLQHFDYMMQERYASDDGTPTATAKRKICSVKSLFGFAHRLGLLDVNVSAAIRVPKTRRRLAERILAQEDVLRAIALSEPKERAVLVIFYASGARCDEMQRLRWRDVRPIGDKGGISIWGKGGKERTVLIRPRTLSDLHELRRGAPDNAPVFAGRGGEPMSARQLERIVKTAAVRAGLPAATSPHWLRHAHVSHALERGAPIHLVAKTVGHASIATTGEYADARPTDSSALYLPI